MAAEKVKNPAASVRARLLNVAKARGDDFDLVLSRYALERLLYRMSVSPHAERFLLKGALLFMVWGVDDHRPTRDADLLGFGDSEPDAVAAMFREICRVECEDSIAFDADSIAAAPIAEEKVYTGVRVTLRAKLDGARIPVQVDVGFGDVVTPEPQAVSYPVLLDAPAPKLRAYPVETVIAEKLHAITVLGMNNSRMKDFYDLTVIGAHFAPDRETLAGAIAATFKRRKTDLPDNLPLALGPQFADDEGKQRQWAAFLRRNRLDEKANSLSKCQSKIVELVRPALEIARTSENSPYKRGRV